MFTEKEKKLLKTFSSKEEFVSFAISSIGQDVQDFINPKVESAKNLLIDAKKYVGDEVKKGTFDPGSPIGNALIGTGVGAGIGGLYGAFKKKKNKGDVLKYALIGAGLGGLGGYAGTHAKSAFDNYRLNAVEKEISSAEQDPNTDPNKIVELYNKRNSLQKDTAKHIDAEKGLEKLGYVKELKDGGSGLMALAEQEYAKGNVKTAATLAKKAQFGSYGKNHPNYGKVGVLPTDEEVVKSLAQRKHESDVLAEKEATSKLNQKINTMVGKLSAQKESHDKDRNWFEKLIGINEFQRNKHWPASPKTEEELLEILRGNDNILSDWAAEELAARQIGV